MTPHPYRNEKLTELERIAGLRSRDVAEGVVLLVEERAAALSRVAELVAELGAVRRQLQLESDELEALRDSARKLARFAVKLDPIASERALVRSRAQEMLDLLGEP